MAGGAPRSGGRTRRNFPAICGEVPHDNGTACQAGKRSQASPADPLPLFQRLPRRVAVGHDVPVSRALRYRARPGRLLISGRVVGIPYGARHGACLLRVARDPGLIPLHGTTTNQSSGFDILREFKMRHFSFAVLSFLALFGCTAPPASPPPTASYLHYDGRNDVLSGGVSMIPIQTPKGVCKVWTKRIGNNPKIKVLLLHGSRGDARV